jgi:hypothetical protein
MPEVNYFKVALFGALGSTSTAGWLTASIKAATELFQCVAALMAAVAGCLTVYYMLKGHRAKPRKPRVGMNIIILSGIFVLFAGCATGPAPQKGGKMRSSFTATTNTVETVQPENPAGAATQNQTITEERKMVLPAKTEVIETRVEPSPSRGLPPTTNETRFILSEPTPVETKIVREATSTVGGAQKDEARTLGVKQAAMRPVMLAGVGLLIAAGVLAYFGNWMMAGISAVIGVGMLVLFVTLPQHGLLIMGIGLAAAVGLVALVYVAYLKGKDENKNGVPDAFEKITPTQSKPLP